MMEIIHSPVATPSNSRGAKGLWIISHLYDL
jgi:hypothetical protein